MKKIFFLSFVFVTVLSLVACDFNAPLRNKMLDYYSDDSNYETVEGTVVSVGEGTFRIDITTENHGFSLASDGYVSFGIIENTEQNYDIKENDKIVFTSAPMYFYNGHLLPLVSLEKEGTVYLTFDDGKEQYLTWIKEAFA